jgi:uncharacterized protein
MDWSLDYGESHLSVCSDIDARSISLEALISNYGLLLAFINRNPLFKASYEPVAVGDDAPLVAQLMAEAAKACGVGPMAAVAGTLAQLVAQAVLSGGAGEVIVDNGGDIYMKIARERVVGVHAGPSGLSRRLAFRVEPEYTPCSICTSSGSVGHSISLGSCDSITVVADSGAYADAAATSLGNIIKSESDIQDALDCARKMGSVRGVLAIKADVVGAWGRLPAIIEE